MGLRFVLEGCVWLAKMMGDEERHFQGGGIENDIGKSMKAGKIKHVSEETGMDQIV